MLRFIDGGFQGLASALVGFLDAAAHLFAAQIAERPMPDALERLGQLLLRFVRPFGKCRQKAVELEGEKFFGFLELALFSSGEFAKLPHRLEAHLGVAHLGDKLTDLAQAFVLPFPNVVTNFAMDQAQRGPRLLQVLARFVHGGAFSVLSGPARLDRAFDLVADDSLNAVADRFILAQLVAHALCLFRLQKSAGGAKEYSPSAAQRNSGKSTKESPNP